MTPSKRKIFLQSLDKDQAFRVLMTLLADDPTLVKKAYAIAVEIVGEANVDEITDDVYHALNSIDVDDLYSSSGKTRHGYVDPYDKAWEMFEEALFPFMHEMEINQKRGLPSEAKKYCIGIIKGLWKYEEKSHSEFKDWITDIPIDHISTVVEEYKEGNPSDEDIAEVMDIVDEVI